MRTGLFVASAMVLASMASVAPAQTVAPRVYAPEQSADAPQIDLWLDQSTYRVGDRIAPHFVTEPGAYVTIVRVTSDGQLAVLYPQRPRDQKPYVEHELVNDRVPLYLSNDGRFQIYESRGVGFVFAIASFEKFDYRYFDSGNEWNSIRLTNDSRNGDPFEIVRRFVDRTLNGTTDFSLDYVSYEVYNDGTRSRYASRYGYDRYDMYDNFYDSCLTAFGLGYSPYCRSSYGGYYPGYYGEVIIGQPRSPSPTVPTTSRPNYAGKHIKPVVGDPLVHGAPTEPGVTEGRVAPSNAAEEAAAAARRERMLRQVTPRDRSGTNVEPAPVTREPRVYSEPVRTEPVRTEPMRSEPVRSEPVYRQPIERPQPVMRAEPRVEQRAEPRPQPVAQPRVEVRNEPVRQQAPPPPRQTATPAAKDNGN